MPIPDFIFSVTVYHLFRFAVNAGCRDAIRWRVVYCADGFSKTDELLMAQKVQFLKDVPPHGNVVRFIGEIEDASGEGSPINVSSPVFNLISVYAYIAVTTTTAVICKAARLF